MSQRPTTPKERPGMAWPAFLDSSLNIFLFAFALPLVCFFVDADLPGPVMISYPVLAWTAAGLGMLGFAASYLGQTAFASGVTSALIIGGAVFAGVLFIALLPLALIGLAVLLIGLLGFIPLGTALVYGRRAERLLTQRACRERWWWAGLATGAVTYIALPAAAHVYHAREMKEIVDGLRVSEDAETRRRALDAAARTWFCDLTCLGAVCGNYAKEEYGVVRQIVGGAPETRCEAILD